MLIRRKMYNVETITVCKTHRPGISRMTLTLREDSDDKMLQVTRQVEKMTEVISARELDIDQSFWREVAIVKFEADSVQFDQLNQNHGFEVLDHQNHDLFIVQVTGTSQMVDDFLEAVGHDKIVEVARSGFTALEK
jgi:acetolactate synthase I/III small subunit